MFKKNIPAIVSCLENSQNDWELRLQAIEKLGNLIEEDDGHLIQQLSRMFTAINNQVENCLRQVLDLRSKLSNRACSIITLCSQKYGNQIQNFIDRFVSKDSLLKLLNNGNRILAEGAFDTLLTIVNSVQTDRYFQKIINQLLASKNVFVRQKLNICLSVVMEQFPEELIEKNSSILEKALMFSVADSSAEVRKVARKSFYSYWNKFNHRAEVLLKKMDHASVKSIKQEYKLDKKPQIKRPETSSYASKSVKIGQIVRQQSVDSKERDTTPNIRKNPTPRKQLGQLKIDNNVSLNVRSRKSFNNYMAEQSSRHSLRPKIDQSVERLNSKRGHHDKKIHDWRTEDLEFLLEKADNENWSTRLMAFQKMHRVLIELNREEQAISQTTLYKIIQSFVKHLEDAHVKVLAQVTQCIADLLEIYPQLFIKYCSNILKRCVKGLSDWKTAGKEDLERLLQSYKRLLGMDMMPHLLQHLEQTKIVKEKTVCLDILIEMMQKQPECLENKNIGLAVKLMANIISEYQKDRSVSLPALAVMSLIKAKNSSAVLNCLLAIGPSQLSKILDLAAQIEPQLEGSILTYIETMDGNNRRKSKTPLTKRQKLNIEDLLDDPTRLDECIEILTERLKQQPEISQLRILHNLLKGKQIHNEDSILKLLSLLHYLTNQEYLLIVTEIIDEMMEESLNQSLLRVLTRLVGESQGTHLEVYLQKLSKMISQISLDHLYKLFDHLDALISSLSKAARAKEPQARRLSIITLADLFIHLEQETILEKLQPNEQRLVQLYVERRSKNRR